VPPPGLQALAAQAAASQAAATATAAPAYAATPAYAAQPAYAAPPPQGKARQQRPERLPDRTRSAAPASPFSPLGVPGAFAPAAAAPASTGGMLARAFGDPASARNAVILAEVLKPPVALR
jgi:hypothetical protein